MPRPVRSQAARAAGGAGPGVPSGPGLSSAEAADRLRRDGPNVLPPARRDRLAVRVLREFREPMAVLLLAAAAVAGLVLGERLDAVAILTIVVLDTAIGIVQEGRAHRALASLADLEAPTAVVHRDGRVRVVQVAHLVVGDLVVLHAGDRVPADLTLDRAAGLEVDEAMLTGESLPVRHGPGEALRAGTLVLNGDGYGTVAATGVDTALGAIAERLADIGSEPTPLQEQLTRLTRLLGLAALGLAAGTTALLLLVDRGEGLEDAFLAGVALAVAAVPEGLAAVTTVALALGVARMADRGAVVRRLPAVETLGSADVLVVDKTGTLTQNRMAVTDVLAPTGRHGAALPADVLELVELVLGLCNDATLEPPTGDPMERALLEHVGGPAVTRLRAQHPRLGAVPFTAERRRMSTVHEVDGRPVALVKGAPEALLPRCVTTGGRGHRQPLTFEDRTRLLAEATQRAELGERLLALAWAPVEQTGAWSEHEERDLSLLALVALRDPPRPSAVDSVAAVRRAGVTLVMATGDHPGTAEAIAREVGIGSRTVTGAALDACGMPMEPLDVDVYARVDPEQKLTLVERLRAGGHVVAMTGDGVNDAPALRRADIGVALGESGSDVAREAADLVVVDDDLATIVAAIHEGRGIQDNLRKVVAYLVTSNLAEVAVVVVALVAFPTLGLPLHPLQLLWINLLTDGLPALALGVDPVDPALLHEPPRHRGSTLLDLPTLRRLAGRATVLAAGALLTLWLALAVAELPTDTARTVLFTTVVLSQVAYALVVRLPRARGVTGRPLGNRWLAVAIGGAVVLQVLVVHLGPLGETFSTVPLSAAEWLLAVLGASVPAAVLAGLALRRSDSRRTDAGRPVGNS